MSCTGIAFDIICQHGTLDVLNSTILDFGNSLSFDVNEVAKKIVIIISRANI